MSLHNPKLNPSLSIVLFQQKPPWNSWRTIWGTYPLSKDYCAEDVDLERICIFISSDLYAGEVECITQARTRGLAIEDWWQYEACAGISLNRIFNCGHSMVKSSTLRPSTAVGCNEIIYVLYTEGEELLIAEVRSVIQYRPIPPFNTIHFHPYSSYTKAFQHS